MDPSTATGTARRQRALIIAESTDEATGTFGRCFEEVRVVTHDQVQAGTDTTGFDVVAVGARDRNTLATTLDAVLSHPQVRDLEILVDLGRELDRQWFEELLARQQDLGLLGLTALGQGRVGLRVRKDVNAAPLDTRIIDVLVDAARLRGAGPDPSPDIMSEVGRLERKTSHQRRRIAELERRLARRRPRPATSQGGASAAAPPPPPAAPSPSLPSRGWRAYLRALDAVLPSLRGASRRRRRGTGLGLAGAVLLTGALLPVAVALIEPGGVRDAVLVLLLEGIGLLLLLDLLYTRRAGQGAGAAAEAASHGRAAARRASANAQRAARQVRRVDQRTRRQGKAAAQLRRRVRELRQQVATDGRDRADRLDALETALTSHQDDVLRQNQALVNLFTLVRVPRALPPLGGWAASPDLALLLVDEIIENRPGTVVECGSGSSTLVMALTARQYDLPLRIISLEHEEQYAQATRELLARHGVSEYADVRYAPLRENSVPDHPAPWYDEDALHGISDIGLLFVDGPPKSTGSLARLPAVPLLRERFAARCTVILDDANRPDEQAVAERWARLLPDFRSETNELQKGALVMRRG